MSKVSLSEELLSLSEAAKSLPGHVHSSTLWRWTSHGCRGIRLEVLRIGGRTYTSRQALDRFARRLSELAAAKAGRQEADNG